MKIFQLPPNSAILSATVTTPFICISYEHKMIGFLKSLNLLKWNSDIETVTFQDLKKQIDQLMKKQTYEAYLLQLQQKHSFILKQRKSLINRITAFIEGGK